MFPREFEDRMKSILGEEYPAFLLALSQPAVRGIRVNNTKISTEDFLSLTDTLPTPISYAPDGFIPQRADEIGRSPEHHAGFFYVQDPGAMATVNALDVREGMWVLDACSAPGGKSSQLASRVGKSGFILSNEYVPKRAKIIVSNFERLGIRNALVTSLDTRELKDMFRGVFDLVLCDAPCSGEGMFRKYDEAVSEWSPENVLSSARRQKEILDNCSGCVKSGGYLLYSTCTYSTEENEGVVSDFLASHPDFSLKEVSPILAQVTKDGITSPDCEYDMSLTRRFYPHIEMGEGQYIALMQRDENIGILPTILYKDATKPLSKEEMAITEKFLSDNLTERPHGRLIKQGEGVALLPHDCPVPKSGVFMPGVMLGEIRRGNFFPHHQLFSAYGLSFKRQENLHKNDPRVSKYLFGEEIDAVETAESGFLAVLYEGVPLGGGKASGGRIKNHYPKGLRNSK